MLRKEQKIWIWESGKLYGFYIDGTFTGYDFFKITRSLKMIKMTFEIWLPV